MSPMFFPFSLTVVTSVVFCAAAMHSTLNSYGSYSESNPSLHMRLNPIDSNFGDSRTGQDRYIYERVPQDQHNRRTEPDSYLNLWDMRNPIEPVVSTRSLYPMELDKEDSNRPHSDETPQVAMFDGTNADLQTKELMASGLLKNKRESHSLSIVNPLDVLRQRLMLEMARRRMKENQDQIRANDVILKTLGKRSSDAPFATSSKDPDDDDEDDEKRLGEGGGARSADRRRSQRRGYMNRQQDSSAVDFEV